MQDNKIKEDWRESAKADEFREYFDKTLKPKKPTMGNLDREIIIDFIAKEIEQAKQKTIENSLQKININEIQNRLNQMKQNDVKMNPDSQWQFDRGWDCAVSYFSDYLEKSFLDIKNELSLN